MHSAVWANKKRKPRERQLDLFPVEILPRRFLSLREREDLALKELRLVQGKFIGTAPLCKPGRDLTV